MAKYEAVDRLMTLATEKRADRIPERAPSLPTTIDASTGKPAGGNSLDGATAESLVNGRHEAPLDPPTAAARGRHLLEAIRPLLPAVAGALRLVDHGAVQAVARLLPLLGGAAGLPGMLPQKATDPAQQEQWLRPVGELQVLHAGTRKEVDALTLQLATANDLLGRTRTQLDRLASEQQTAESMAQALGDRVRLLSAGLIILLMLIIAQMILLVVMLHR